jgi:hypothetical protein
LKLTFGRPDFSGERVLYESSYNAFATSESHVPAKQEKDRGRKIFGSFIPNLDVSATLIQILTTFQELLQTADGERAEDQNLPIPSDEDGRGDESRTNVQKRAKRMHGEGLPVSGDRKGKRLKRKQMES